MRKRPLEFLALLYIVAWTISPPLQVGMAFRIAALGCAGFIAFQNRFRMKKEHAIALLFVALVALTAYITGGLSGVIKQIGIYMLFLGFLMNDWYRDEWEDFKAIIPIVLLLLVVWNFRTVSVLATDANAARNIVRSGEATESYLRQGVGGYGLVYSQVIISPVLLSWIISVFKQNKALFACGAAWAVSYVWLLMQSGYSIAVFTTVVGLVVFLFVKRKQAAPALLVSLLVTAVIVYLICYNDTVRNYLLDVFDGTKVAGKIRDITSTVTTDETADSIQVRIARYRADLDTMLKYPVIGSWANGGAGGHSALMGAFAQYGVFGGLVMLMMIYCVPFVWKRRPCSVRAMKTVNAAIVTITFVVLLDTLPFNLVMMLTVIFPLLMTDIESGSTENENFVDSQFDPV